MKGLYIKNIIIFFSIIVIINIASGLFFKKNFEDITYSFYGEINNSLKSDSEILILGSSRAKHHYDPLIISNILKRPCYNAGFGGYGLFLNYAVLKERIKKHTPKIVILDLSPNTMAIGENSYSKLDKLLPYYEEYPSFKEIILLNSKHSKLELVSNLYIYNSTLYDFIKNYLDDIDSHDGFTSLEGQLNKKTFESNILQDEEYFDKNKIDYLNKIIDLCKINDVKLIGIVSPTYLKFDKKNRIINEMKLIFNNNNVDFLDFSNYLKLYQDSIFFKDQLHMNGLGAEIFSEDLSHKLKTTLLFQQQKQVMK